MDKVTYLAIAEDVVIHSINVTNPLAPGTAPPMPGPVGFNRACHPLMAITGTTVLVSYRSVKSIDKGGETVDRQKYC